MFPNCADSSISCGSQRSNVDRGCGGRASVEGIRPKPERAMCDAALVRRLRFLTCFPRRSACQACQRSRTPSGSGFVHFCQHRSRRQADQPPIIARSLRECSGSCVPARLGASCRSALDPGPRWPVVINAGVKQASGHKSCTSCRPTRTRKPRQLEPLTVTVVLGGVCIHKDKSV